MNKPSPLVYFALVAYIFAPTVAGWLMNPHGEWYRPYGLWLVVVIVAFCVQKYKQRRKAPTENI